MSLIAELRRRNVIRMAGLYLVGAWLIAQVAETILPAFDVPNWVMRAIVIVLALGFVPAMVFAWVFELTPVGLKRDGGVRPEESIGPKTAQRMNRMIVALLVLALLYFGFDKFVLAPRRDAALVAAAEQRVAPPSSAKPFAKEVETSIAVLPFVNMSSDKEQDYFSDGLSEELLNQLAQIPQLRVIARTSSFSFKGKEVDVATIAKTLGVDHVLEGSVRKSGNTLRITAQLVRSSDSSHLWSQTYDRQLTDVFRVQDEIASEVVDGLKITLLPGQAPVGTGRTGNIEAYKHYLRGRQSGNSGSVDGQRQAITEFQQAIELDPGYISAFANLASTQAVLADQTADPALQILALQSVDKALELAPDDAEAHAVRGWLRTLFLWDWEGAQADFGKALRLDANNPGTLWRHAWLLAALGRLPEAIASARKAVDLDPVAMESAGLLGIYLDATGQYAQAREVLGRKLSFSGKDDSASRVLGESLVLDGQPAEAILALRQSPLGARLVTNALAEHSLGRPSASQHALDELEQKYASGYAYQIAEIHAWRGDKDKTFEWLDRAYSQRDGGLATIKYDPFLKPLHGDPRYLAMVRKLGLPE